MESYYRLVADCGIHDEYVEGDCRWGLSRSAKCNVCNLEFMKSFGWVHYPWLPDSVFNENDRKFLKKNRNNFEIDAKRHLGLVEIIRSVVGASYPVGNFTQFGQFCGKLCNTKALPDFIIPLPGFLLVKAQVAHQMENTGFDIKHYPIELKGKGTNSEHKFVDLWMPPIGLVGGQKITDECPACLSVSYSFKDQGVQRLAPQFDKIPLFLLRSFGVQLANDRFVKWYQSHGFSGLRFLPVKIASPINNSMDIESAAFTSDG